MEQIHYEEEFYSPFGGLVLIKANEDNGKWEVYLQASNEGIDQEKEVVVCKALKDAKDYFLGHGVLSYDHKHKQLHDPEYIIGEPTDVAFTKSNETLVKGWLYKENRIAQKLWRNILSGAKKLGASIGGGILKKSAGRIEKVVWDECALTPKPVQDLTLGHVQLIPFPEFAKALMAGGGVNAANFSGGRALTEEDLAKKMTDATFAQADVGYRELRKYTDGVISKVVKGQITSMNDVIDYTKNQGFNDSVAASLIEFISTKIPRLRR